MLQEDAMDTSIKSQFSSKTFKVCEVLNIEVYVKIRTLNLP